MTQKERAQKLAAAHWDYTGGLLRVAQYDAEVLVIAEFLYKAAAVHFYGHGIEDYINGMFATGPADPSPEAAPLCPSCRRYDTECHGANDEYPATSDGGCEGYIKAEKESLCNSCEFKGCMIDTGHTEFCTSYRSALRERMMEAKEDAALVVDPPVAKTGIPVNCKACGTTSECVGKGINMLLEKGCAGFTADPKPAPVALSICPSCSEHPGCKGQSTPTWSGSCNGFSAKKETWTRYDIWQKVEKENARSKEIHGSWHKYTPDEQVDAIRNEWRETREAFKLGDVDGEHGEVAELVQLANLCFRRIQFLKGEADA
jgi:hypothetical protein